MQLTTKFRIRHLTSKLRSGLLWGAALTLLPALAVFLHRREVPEADEAGKEDLTGGSVTATLTQNRSSLDSIGETVNVTG